MHNYLKRLFKCSSLSNCLSVGGWLFLTYFNQNHITTDWVEKPIRESSCLLLSQTCKNVTQASILLNLFQKVVILKSYLTPNEFIVIFNELIFFKIPHFWFLLWVSTDSYNPQNKFFLEFSITVCEGAALAAPGGN